MSTLTVLAIGFVGVSTWETVFRWLRTKLYSETSQKLDVQLGAKLFRHLLRLPLGYFEARHVGDTAMRVCQLETIREFLTNASLSVLVDPAFIIVVLVAMRIYSTKLFVISVLTVPAYGVVAALMRNGIGNLGRHGAAKLVGLGGRKAGADNRAIHRLLLKERDAERLFQHRAQSRAWITRFLEPSRRRR